MASLLTARPEEERGHLDCCKARRGGGHDRACGRRGPAGGSPSRLRPGRDGKRWPGRWRNWPIRTRMAETVPERSGHDPGNGCHRLPGRLRAHETPLDANCGLCGGAEGCVYFYTRRETSKGLVDVTDRQSETPIKGPLCGARVDDLGYVMGSAIWMAQTLLVDARPFMSVGLAGQKLGYCPNSGIVVGIPMATLSKSPYQDVPVDLPSGQHGQDGRQQPKELCGDPADRFRHPLRLPQAVPQSEEGGITWPG